MTLSDIKPGLRWSQNGEDYILAFYGGLDYWLIVNLRNGDADLLLDEEAVLEAISDNSLQLST